MSDHITLTPDGHGSLTVADELDYDDELWVSIDPVGGGDSESTYLTKSQVVKLYAHLGRVLASQTPPALSSVA